jgi:hypothetical protein
MKCRTILGPRARRVVGLSSWSLERVDAVWGDEVELAVGGALDGPAVVVDDAVVVVAEQDEVVQVGGSAVCPVADVVDRVQVVGRVQPGNAQPSRCRARARRWAGVARRAVRPRSSSRSWCRGTAGMSAASQAIRGRSRRRSRCRRRASPHPPAPGPPAHLAIRAAEGVEGDGDDQRGADAAGEGELPAGGDPGEDLGEGVGAALRRGPRVRGAVRGGAGADSASMTVRAWANASASRSAISRPPARRKLPPNHSPRRS